MWKKISSKIIFKHPRLTLIEDKVNLPNGSKTTYLKFKDVGNAATIICQSKDGKILLQKEYSYPINKRLFQFPGGYIPNHESLKKGANWELMEEAGLKAKDLKFIGKYFVNHRRSGAKIYVYLTHNFDKKSLSGDIEEEITSFWFIEKGIDLMIKKGKIINSSVLAAWSLYKANKKN